MKIYVKVNIWKHGRQFHLAFLLSLSRYRKNPKSLAFPTRSLFRSLWCIILYTRRTRMFPAHSIPHLIPTLWARELTIYNSLEKSSSCQYTYVCCEGKRNSSSFENFRLDVKIYFSCRVINRPPTHFRKVECVVEFEGKKTTYCSNKRWARETWQVDSRDNCRKNPSTRFIHTLLGVDWKLLSSVSIN